MSSVPYPRCPQRGGRSATSRRLLTSSAAPARSGGRSTVARLIEHCLKRIDAPTPTLGFNVGVHASIFVGMELADRCNPPRQFTRALDEAEDLAALARVGRFTRGLQGLAGSILDEIERRWRQEQDDDE